VLRLSGVWNLRDVGGLTTPGGATVRTGRFLRSGQLSWLDDAGGKMLQDTGITDVADLRSPHELERYGPDRVPDGIVVHNLPFPDIDGAEGEAPHEEAYRRVVREGTTDEELPAAEAKFMKQEYRRFARLQGAQRAVQRLISLLGEGKPVLAHCFAGKDRTGFAVAVVLATLGVDREAIMDDYMRSNDAVPELRDLMLEMLESRTDISDEARELAQRRLSTNVLGVRREYLSAALETIDEDYGSLDGYLRAAGVEPRDIEAMRAALLG
jgi:protein-tyrosine phosphatase